MVGAKTKSALWVALAFALSLTVLFFIFRKLDIEQLLRVFERAKISWLLLLVVLVPLEQVVRAWKWRQILFDIQKVRTLHLFGAVMAGYFANMAVPLGISPLVRAWLIARRESLKLATVLMTTAIERFVDGIVFSGLVGVFVVFAELPVFKGDLREGVLAAGLGGFILFGGLLWTLYRGREMLNRPHSFIGRLVGWLENRFQTLNGLGESIFIGIVWPKERKRGIAVFFASLMMKMISGAHFLWAGLAVGVVLAPFDYLFILILSSFAGILGKFIRIPGGFVIGAALALELLKVPGEEALAMVSFVHLASVSTTVAIGALAFWRSGLSLSEVRDLRRVKQN